MELSNSQAMEEGAINMSEIRENANGMQIYSKKDLLEIFPFKRTKLQQLLSAGVLPVVKVGRTYLSSPEILQRWLLENVGREILY